MESLYSKLSEAVEMGASFHIDFQKRNMKVDGKWIVKEGVYADDAPFLVPSDYKITFTDNLSYVEYLYEQYKYSLPSEKSNRKYKLYFKAISIDEMSDEDMVFGERRELAQFKLEAYILFSILNGNLTWNEETMGKWFWQSKIDPDLVILKQWITSIN